MDAKLDSRRSDLASIHIAKKALKWTEDEYRDIMATVCGGVRSAGQLDIAGRKRFLAHLQACVRANGGGAGPAPRAQKRALKPFERKMWALWMQLADAGLVTARTMKALNAFARRQTGVDTIEWLNQHQRDLVIESLKRWLDRREDQQP